MSNEKTIKVWCGEWVGGIKNLPSWWKKKDYVEVTPAQILELYETGVNVMIYHDQDGHCLFVDTKRFTQR